MITIVPALGDPHLLPSRASSGSQGHAARSCGEWAPTAVARRCLRSALLPAPPSDPTAAAAWPPPAPRGLWGETGKAPLRRWKPELSACLSFPPSILLLLLPLPPSLPLSLPPVGNSLAMPLQWDRQGKES